LSFQIPAFTFTLMKKIGLALLALSLGCGGNLSDEQRKKFKEGMEQQKIVRITEAEIMEAGLSKGHQILKALENKPFSQGLADSLAQAYKVKINWTVPGGSNALAIEQELIDAYIAGMATGSIQENLQKIYNSSQGDKYDSLLYSKPSLSKLPDGSEQLNGIWNIYIPKKQIVLEITKTK
jgi:hypothetical protein